MTAKPATLAHASLLKCSPPRKCFSGSFDKRGRGHRQGFNEHATGIVFAQQNFATQFIGGGFGGANEIFVAGADSQLGARVVQKLLQAGFKVTAGVPDEEQAQAAVDFAGSVELLRKPELQKLRLAEIDLNDADSIAAALPKRGARVLAVIGSPAGKVASRLDARAASRVLQAAQQTGASQFVLVAPSGSGGGGGGLLGGLFGGGSKGGSGTRLSKIEQEITESGLGFIIVRSGRTDVQDLGSEGSTNVAVGPQASLPSQSRITNGQVASVVQQVVRLGQPDLLIEAWSSADAPDVSVEEAVSEVLPLAAFGGEAEEAEAEAEDESVTSAGAEEDEVEVPKTPGGLFGGLGTRRIKAGRGDAPQSLQQRSPAGSNGSTQAGPTSPKKSGFGFGKKQRADSADEPEDNDADGKKGGGLGGLLGGSKKQVEQAEISPERARKSAVRGAQRVGKETQRGAQLPPGADQQAPPKKGFFASLGFGGDTKFVDDED